MPGSWLCQVLMCWVKDVYFLNRLQSHQSRLKITPTAFCVMCMALQVHFGDALEWHPNAPAQHTNALQWAGMLLKKIRRKAFV